MREPSEFNNTGTQRIMLVKQEDDDQISLYDSLNAKGASRLVDDRVNLVQESFPNYARIDHFAQDLP